MVYRIWIYVCAFVFLSACGGSGNSDDVDSPVLDITPPTIILNGDDEITLEVGSPYEEQGATASDNLDIDVDVLVSGTVDTMTLGAYILTYTASDKAGNTAMTTRMVSVVDTTPPTITLNGDEQIEHVQGRDYLDKGAVAFDAVDGELQLTVIGEVDVTTLDGYTLTYRATDLSGNSTSVERVVTVREEKPFIIRWQISSDSLTTSLLANPDYSYNYTIDWGDGQVDTNVTGDITHTYASEGEYAVSIRGIFPHFRFQQKYRLVYDEDGDEYWLCSNCSVIRAVVQWGDINWRDMTEFFYKQYNFTSIETDQSPNLSQVSSLSSLFYYSKFNGDISQWDVSNVTDMKEMFRYSRFNGDISQWNVSSVENMAYMFDRSRFNDDISQWDVTNVTDMSSMFSYSQFNGDVSQWDVSNVTDMSSMFAGSQFTGDVSQWDVSNVTDLRGMFAGSQFTGDISEWDVSNVENMSYMFNRSRFDGDLSQWDVSSVTDMKWMFYLAYDFNGDISLWDVSNVTDMKEMFRYSRFNSDISQWDVNSVKDMTWMFSDSQFYGDISQWDVSNVTTMEGMFESSQFHGDISQWDVSSVTDMNEMFSYSKFNGDISRWDVSNVTNMYGMFSGTPFNGDISQWDVSSVTNMQNMFLGSSFNGDISQWDVSSVTNMANIFSYSPFNDDISQWDVSNVTTMYGMFAGGQFTGDISEWDVSSVTTMEEMFKGELVCGEHNCTFVSNPFNGDISRWDVSSVTDMRTMFDSSQFNGDISQWDVSSVTTMEDMFSNSALSQANYDALLNSWSQRELQDNVRFDVDQVYSEQGAAGRAILTDVFNWRIYDKGLQPESSSATTSLH